MEKQLQPCYFYQLSETLAENYPYNFGLTPEGDLFCFSCMPRTYDISEVEIELGDCPTGMSVYLIKTKDGKFRGTLIEYWEF